VYTASVKVSNTVVTDCLNLSLTTCHIYMRALPADVILCVVGTTFCEPEQFSICLGEQYLSSLHLNFTCHADSIWPNMRKLVVTFTVQTFLAVRESNNTNFESSDGLQELS